MTGRFALLLAGALGVTAPVAAQAVPSTAPGFVAEVMRQFDGSMQKFVALAEAMPADKYGWSPGPGVMSVAKVFGTVGICYAIIPRKQSDKEGDANRLSSN